MKYGNRQTTVDGIKFASAKEARRYEQLRLLEKAKRIRDLRQQVVYRISINGVLICTYRADFVYEELIRQSWLQIVEDVKGYATPVYRLKKKLMRAVHGIEIVET